VPAGTDMEYLKAAAPLLGICVGLAIRQPSDKIIPDFM